jgi:hypothetical protein
MRLTNWLGAFVIFRELIPLLCRECSYEKNCQEKEKPPQSACERFERYEDSKTFKVFDRMMRSNRESEIKD